VTFDPHADPGSELREAREAARRQATTLSGPLVALLGGLLAAFIVFAFWCSTTASIGPAPPGEDPDRRHRGGGHPHAPMFGLFLLPIVTPFLGWLRCFRCPG